MPIFEYKCEECGHVFEQFTFGNTSGEVKACPNCGKPGAKRIPSSFSSVYNAGNTGAAGGCCGPSGGFS